MAKTTILKVLIGSRAYGVHDDDSDYDYRSVYVRDMVDTVKMEFKVTGREELVKTDIGVDSVGYELGHFIALASKSNPTILEILRAPIVEANEDGKELQSLFPYLWSKENAFNAFVGYGYDQRKKLLKNQDGRKNKYAVAYVRTLYNLINLFTYKTFDVKIEDPRMMRIIRRFKSGGFTTGELIDLTEDMIEEAKMMGDACDQEQDMTKPIDFLIRMRLKYWNGGKSVSEYSPLPLDKR